MQFFCDQVKPKVLLDKLKDEIFALREECCTHDKNEVLRIKIEEEFQFDKERK